MRASLLLLCCLVCPVPAAAPASPLDDEGPIGNSTPLPAHREAEQALAKGDEAWERAAALGLGNGRDRAGLRNAAFDAWRSALESSPPTAGVRLKIDDSQDTASFFPDPDALHSRRAEGVSEGVQRRLASLSNADREAWTLRFEALAGSRLADTRASLAQGTLTPEEAVTTLSSIERIYPFTESALLAALSLHDLSLEAGRPTAAGAWLDRAKRHFQRTTSGRDEGTRNGLGAALVARSRRRSPGGARAGRDHTDFVQAQAPRPAPVGSGSAQGGPGSAEIPIPVTTQRITGLIRRSDEPFGLGLTSGACFLRDSTVVIQGAHGVLSLTPTEDGDSFAIGFTGAQRSQYTELLDIRQPIGRAAPSSGGWPSLPATDGEHIALVIGRGEPPRSFRDVEIASTGNYLAYCGQGPANRPLTPLWIIQDGLVSNDPAGSGRNPQRDKQDASLSFRGINDTFSRFGRPQGGWNLGSGWEFQPGPVLADGRLFVLARGLGGPQESESEGAAPDGADTADELRLLALDAMTAELLWSVSVTRERGLLAGSSRGEGGYYAVTAMPLGLDRATGTLLVGTNSGLLAAYGTAEGRLLWAFRNQRRSADEGGWPGSRAPLLTTGPSGKKTAWFTPFDSSCAYALPAGPAPLDGSLYLEEPRQRGAAIALAAALPPSPADARRDDERSTLLLMGRYGRHGALLIDKPGQPREPAAYLAPGDQFAGTAALDRTGEHLWVAGARELSGFAQGRDFRLEQAAPLPSQGAGTGGDVVLHRNFLYVLGRDTVWVYRTSGS